VRRIASRNTQTSATSHTRTTASLRSWLVTLEAISPGRELPAVGHRNESSVRNQTETLPAAASARSRRTAVLRAGRDRHSGRAPCHRDVDPSAVRDLLDHPPRATVAFVDGGAATLLPACFRRDEARSTAMSDLPKIDGAGMRPPL